MERKSYFDVVKGVAICAVVIGHSSSLLHDFVYTWHLAVFLFIMGYLYNREKHVGRPWEYLGHKTGSSWIKYVGYSLVILFVYVFIKKYGYLNGSVLGLKDIAYEIINIIFFGGGVPLQGTLWFVPMMLLCACMFCGILYWQDKICFLHGRLWINLLPAFFIGFLGLWITNRGTDLKMFLNLSMVMLPVCMTGYLIKEKFGNRSDIVSVPIGIGAGICNYVFSYLLNWDINLAFNNTGGGYKFYLITAVGVYMALALSKVLNQMNITRILFSFLGKYSFEIMALHFSVFKLLDLGYGKIFPGKYSTEILSGFPTAGVINTCVYVLMGCLIPALVGLSASRIWTKIKGKWLV